MVENEMSNLLEQLSGKRVLITGASGFLGSHLCDHLDKNGIEVHAVSRSKRAVDQGSVHWWQGDMEDLKVVQNLFHTIKPDVVYHLSGHVTGVAGLELVLPTFQSLLVSTVNVLTVAAKMGCDRLILISSLEEPEPGHNEATPASPYAAAKWASSAYGRMFHQLYQTPVVLVRLFMTYGPRQNVRKIIPSVTLSLLRGDAPKLASGQRQVDWIYIDDAISGMLAAAQVSNLEGCTLDLGSGTLVSIRSVVQQLTNLVNPQIKPLFGALPDRPVEKVRVANTTYTYEKLGWQPLTSLERGLENTVNWYKQQLEATKMS
jgi:nucleoside-diphosphate-sugar epimerase